MLASVSDRYQGSSEFSNSTDNRVSDSILCGSMRCDGIANVVKLDGGIKRLPMSVIKQQVAPYWERLSDARAEEVTEQLKRRGILTWPPILPTDERNWVVLVEEESAIGEALLLARRAIACSKMGVPLAPGAHEEFRKLAGQA
ncbi:hypothetical protein [Streptomyces sp. AA1529]|uniref:hypothetical protein n=1 Tax=Streptomyces sp. AA1529 TaxID=1203257 RepID=UPI003D72B2E5